MATQSQSSASLTTGCLFTSNPTRFGSLRQRAMCNRDKLNVIRLTRVDLLDQPTFKIHHSGRLVISADVGAATRHLAGTPV